MEHLMACRICLATDVKLYEMSKYRLTNAYENLTGMKMSHVSSLQHVCSYCGTLLIKYRDFRDRCQSSLRLMEGLLEEHTLVTTCHIKSENLHTFNIALPYTLHVTQIHDSTVAIKHENDFDIDNLEYDHRSDISDDNEMKNENIKTIFHDQKDDKYDSDEEPLAKTVKRKRKKSKKDLKCDKVEVKTEKNDDYATDDVIYSTNDDNYAANNETFYTNDENYPKNDEIYENNDRDLKNPVINLITNHELVILSHEEQLEELAARKTSSNYLNSIYKCDNCYKGFMTEVTYKNHMARHDPCSGAARCAVCATRWPDARALRAHQLNSHERRYTCRMCGHSSKSAHKAREHNKWHDGVMFPCTQCDRQFSKSTSYLTHVRLRHGSHACAVCGLSFIGRTGLNMHTKKAHRDEKVEPTSVHKCERCQVAFRSTEALMRHSDVTSGECSDNLCVCTQCGDHFASDQLLKQHIEGHKKNDALRTCSQCSRTFAHERSLAAHIHRTHTTRAQTQPRHCVCELCGYKCMSASSLVNHQRVHSGEKPHACPLCPKTFTVAQRLQIHIRTHTGERPFQCARCPKAFKHKAALNRHDRVHTGAKPYACPQCGKRFSQSNSMKQHCAGVHLRAYIYSRGHKHTNDNQ